MLSLHECSIVHSSWPDCIKLVLIKSGFGFVRERQSLVGVNNVSMLASLKHDFF